MKRHAQKQKQTLRICERCKEERSDTDKVSDLIWPGGGYLCQPCLVPAAAETNRIGG